MLCDRLHAWWLTQSRLTILLPSLINEGSGLKSFNKVGWGSMPCLWSGPPGSTVGFLLLQRFSKGLAVKYSSYFISALNLDLYVCCFDAWMSRSHSRGPKARLHGRKTGLSPPPPASNLSLTVPRWCFCCGLF